jgi:hypothetical protein
MELHSVRQLVFNSGINVCFISVQVLLLHIYFFIRYREMRRVIDENIGLGDILFLISICFLLSPLNFIVFHCCSLMLSLVIFQIWNLLRRGHVGRIGYPLAGIQAIFLLVFMGYNVLEGNSISDDIWVLNKFIY